MTLPHPHLSAVQEPEPQPGPHQAAHHRDRKLCGQGNGRREGPATTSITPAPELGASLVVALRGCPHVTGAMSVRWENGKRFATHRLSGSSEEGAGLLPCGGDGDQRWHPRRQQGCAYVLPAGWHRAAPTGSCAHTCACRAHACRWTWDKCVLESPSWR